MGRSKGRRVAGDAAGATTSASQNEPWRVDEPWIPLSSIRRVDHIVYFSPGQHLARTLPGAPPQRDGPIVLTWRIQYSCHFLFKTRECEVLFDALASRRSHSRAERLILQKLD